jgi:hypothetical protein
LLLAKIITTITLRAHKIQGLNFKDLKQLLIAPNSQENSGKAQPAGCVCPREKSPLAISLSLFFLSISRRQNINQHQTL